MATGVAEPAPLTLIDGRSPNSAGHRGAHEFDYPKHEAASQKSSQQVHLFSLTRLFIELAVSSPPWSSRSGSTTHLTTFSRRVDDPKQLAREHEYFDRLDAIFEEPH
jgi:hypothetical protein